jgi:putative hydrolase of the HAD superfamily
MPKYKAILFDLDGTLRANLPEGFEIFVEFAGLVGIVLTNEQMKSVEREAHRYWADGARVDSDLMRYDKRDFWINYNHSLLKSIGVPQCEDCAHRIQDLFDEHFDPQDVVFADTYTTLNKLKNEGYVMGLVTNRDKEVDPYLSQIKILDYFNFTLTGGQAKCFKPASGIFNKALDMAGVNAHEAVYVGDNYYADVVGAKNVGMDAILIDPRNCFVKMHDKRVRHLRNIAQYMS